VSIVGAEYLENYRAELIYSPTIISRLESGPYSTNPIVKLISSREDAEKMADSFNQLSEYYRAEKRVKWHVQRSEEMKNDQPEI
jgi:hypothetical protein